LILRESPSLCVLSGGRRESRRLNQQTLDIEKCDSQFAINFATISKRLRLNDKKRKQAREMEEKSLLLLLLLVLLLLVRVFVFLLVFLHVLVLVLVLVLLLVLVSKQALGRIMQHLIIYLHYTV
jgi:Flp pilus assembly protein TadB